MSGEFKMTIGRAVREIAQYYSSEESFAIKTGKHLPNRGAIIGVIKDLRRVMFPGYFGTENITDTAPEYFIGNTLTEVYVVLKQQIEIALNYQNEENKKIDRSCYRIPYLCISNGSLFVTSQHGSRPDGEDSYGGRFLRHRTLALARAPEEGTNA